ncbi:MAG: glutaminyl-peptide cyclotransferase [Bacteroidetes bacterium]|jgi:glutaminyl-peptide cyclotransferase|nr:glutaminyl-peptide cyclotransferase [Bacteroidota bacterium]MBT5527820.1 glutaminyl-peptide cyclotransferase [Cytophagia bacterium]MBT3802634.1 glutaminyl-peptide cyclotransferase [Bacteroidota bacterium]MBT3932994.1 glutaminyl-peptide cyclotransferase [Bacteroidota bacterium]MBT4728359.1 glutaminyl-peptide cyclotransferase [Bacteroidota bacterium]
MIKRLFLIFILVNLLINLVLFSCKRDKQSEEKEKTQTPSTTPKFQQLKLKLIREIPHAGDKRYTQGFEFYNGILYESTGLDNQSSLKKIDPATGELLLSKDLNNFFAEGITIYNGYITLISYRAGKAFSYHPEDLSEKGIAFDYDTEGWGLANNGSQYIMSDGSDKIYFRNPFSFKVERTINVKYKGRPVHYVNELEYVDGKIYANIYGTKNILVINENTGKVEAEIDASSILCSHLSGANPEAVLNGIAYNPESKTFFITGKECPNIYEVVFE